MKMRKQLDRGEVLQGRIRSLSQTDSEGWARREIILEQDSHSGYPDVEDPITLVDSDEREYRLTFVRGAGVKGYTCLGQPAKLKPWFNKHYAKEFVTEDQVFCVKLDGINTFRLFTSTEWNLLLKSLENDFPGFRFAVLNHFTVYDEARFVFCPGINILIGENGTGKTHLLKLLYAVSSQLWKLNGRHGIPSLEATFGYNLYLQQELEKIFLTGDKTSLKDLMRLGYTDFSFICGVGNLKASFQSVNKGSDGEVILHSDFHTPDRLIESLEPKLTRPLYIPSHEHMSIFPGFTALYEKRHIPFDQTSYDLCVALAEAPLREIPKTFEPILAELEEVLGGSVELSGDGRFFLVTPKGKISMSLLAEGHRKFAMLARLLLTGELLERKILFWDEPETNLNPKMVTVLKRVLLKLAEHGVQIFIATHDYLLASELSIENEAKISGRVPIRFFSLYQGKKGVQVEAEEVMADLEHNPILAEYAAHYDRETLALGGTLAK